MIFLKNSVQVFLLMAFIALVISTIKAQSSEATVTTPVTGDLFFSGNLPGDVQPLFRMNTRTGLITRLVAEGVASSGSAIAPSGDKLVFSTIDDRMVIYDLRSSSSSDVSFLSPPPLSARPVEDWSPDGRQLLTYLRTRSESGNLTYRLQILDLNSQTIQTIFSEERDTAISSTVLSGVPEDFVFNSVNFAEWNPVFPDWFLVQVELVPPPDTRRGNVTWTIIANFKTGETIGLENNIPDTGNVGRATWHPEGQYIALQGGIDTNVTQIIKFDPSESQVQFLHELRVFSGDVVLHGWLDIDHLLLTGFSNQEENTTIFYINRIINGTWYEQEFLRISKDDVQVIGEADWLLQADMAERHRISCLFDQALPSRVSSGDRAIVVHSDTVPLRSEPSLDSESVRDVLPAGMMNIVGSSACTSQEDFYRFWQVRLLDGTEGWIAEANTQNYFLDTLSDRAIQFPETFIQ